MKARLSMVAIATATLAACATQQEVAVRHGFEPSSGEALAMVVPARGVQIYECRAKADPAQQPEWVFIAPEAELFDARGRSVGRHGAGPNWQYRDGSRVVGKVTERLDAPIAGAVPWLMLAAKSEGPDGALSRVTSIQRVNTQGGLAPAEGCRSDTRGTQVRVAYSADYLFYAPR